LQLICHLESLSKPLKIVGSLLRAACRGSSPRQKSPPCSGVSAGLDRLVETHEEAKNLPSLLKNVPSYRKDLTAK
jgi:hypothetical protein